MNIFPGLVLKRRIKEIKTNYTDPRIAKNRFNNLISTHFTLYKTEGSLTSYKNLQVLI